MACPTSNGPLTCDRVDTYAGHMMLLHRNEEAQREWTITAADKKRWGLEPKKRKSTKVTEEESDVVE